MRLQFPDVLDDLVDLRITEGLTKGRHRTGLAVLDAVAEKIVVAARLHQLWPLPGRTAPVGMTPAAGRCEQLLDIEGSAVRRRGSLLRGCGHGERQPASENNRRQRHQLHAARLPGCFPTDAWGAG